MDLDDVEALNVLAKAGTDEATVGDLTGTDLKRAGIDLGADGVPDTVVLNGTDGRDSRQRQPLGLRGRRDAASSRS